MQTHYSDESKRLPKPAVPLSVLSVLALSLIFVGAGTALAQQGAQAGTSVSDHANGESEAQSGEELDRWTLSQCIESALEHNRRRAASEFAVAVAMAEAQHRQALAGYWPQVHLKGGFQRLDESPNFLFPASRIPISLPGAAAAGDLAAAATALLSPGAAGTSPTDPSGDDTGLSIPVPEQNVILSDPTSFLGSADLVWLLWDGGMRKGYREQANGQVDLRRHQARQTDLQILDTVYRYYYGAVLAGQIHDVGRITLERMEATLDLTEMMYREGSGRVNKTDYLDNKIMVESIRSLVASLEKNERMAQAALANAAGLSWRNSLQPAETEIPFEPVDLNLPELVSLAYSNSPDWGQLEGGLRALEGALRTAKSGHFPKIAATAGSSQVVERPGLGPGHGREPGWLDPRRMFDFLIFWSGF
ncbi:MAG: TolC family protein [Candidatus Eisenbacteria bacterium]